jgi:hypothetical protein
LRYLSRNGWYTWFQRPLLNGLLPKCLEELQAFSQENTVLFSQEYAVYPIYGTNLIGQRKKKKDRRSLQPTEGVGSL